MENPWRCVTRLTLTWDVLKRVSLCGNNAADGLTLTWDVLKLHIRSFQPYLFQINFNMGCIETRQNGGTTATKPRLTLTWDVLKRVRVLPPFLIYWINFNMGCIETA